MGGRAEAIRVAFHIGGVEFEDDRISDFAERKKNGDFNFGQVPVLFVDSEQFAQSNALLRYAGKKADLYPTDALEALRVDEALDTFQDIISKLIPTFYIKDDKEKLLAARQKIVAEDWPVFFNGLSKKLDAAGGLFSAKLSIADISFYCLLKWFSGGVLDGVETTVLDAYPTLVKFLKRLSEDATVQAYYKDHKN